MQTETHYKIRITRITYLIGQVIFLGISIYISQKITCPFKRIFHISCPFCGLTRSCIALMNLKIKEAISYNILTIPTIMITFIIDIIFIIEIILNKRMIKKERINYKWLTIIIIISLMLSTLHGMINNI